MYYKLNPDKSVSPCDVAELKAHRALAHDVINGYTISTVFFGIDHNHTKVGDPILFETMVFDEGFNEVHCSRHTTYQDANNWHSVVFHKLSTRRFGFKLTFD